MLARDANRQMVEQLLPLELEKEDSGIDSDDTEPARESSQDDAPKEIPEVIPIMPWDNQLRCQEHQKQCDDSDDDRASSLLLEVELTASDEDDESSVLELVIAVQSSRYHRVPTSSPKKNLPAAPTLFSSLFCCLRK